MNVRNAAWQKSSYSGNNGGDCVEVAKVDEPDAVLVRDSKNPHRGHLTVSSAEWNAFLDDVKRGRFAS